MGEMLWGIPIVVDTDCPENELQVRRADTDEILAEWQDNIIRGKIGAG